MDVTIHHSRLNVLNLFILGRSINVSVGYTDGKIGQHILQNCSYFSPLCLLQWSQINLFACIDMKSVPEIPLSSNEGRNRQDYLSLCDPFAFRLIIPRKRLCTLLCSLQIIKQGHNFFFKALTECWLFLSMPKLENSSARIGFYITYSYYNHLLKG